MRSHESPPATRATQKSARRSAAARTERRSSRPHRQHPALGRAGHRGAGVPVPLLLHGDRLAADASPTPTLAGAFPNPANITLRELRRHQRAHRPAAGSGQFGHLHRWACILCTLVFGVLAGYALSVLHWRGRGVTFAILLLVQIVPFQLLMIPLYVLIARDYGLSDTYFGMILPFAINSAAVLIFRQYFLQVPRALFDAARIDGASELRVLWSIALPLVRPAVLTVVLLTFIGPVERVPLAVPDHQGGVAAAAGGVARQLHHDGGGIGVQPVRGDPRGCRGARHPGCGAVHHLPASLQQLRHRIGSEGMTDVETRLPTVPYTLTRVGVDHDARGGQPARGRGRAQSRHRDAARTASSTCCRAWSPQATCRASDSPASSWRTACRSASSGRASCSSPTGRGSAASATPASRTRGSPGWPISACFVMTYVAYGPLGPRTALAVSTDLREWRRLGPVLFTYDDALDIDLNLFHNKDAVFFPEPVTAPDGVRSFAVLHRPMWDLSETKADQGVVVPAGITDPRQSIWISYVPVEAVAKDLSALDAVEPAPVPGGPGVSRSRSPRSAAGPLPLRVPEGWLLLHHGVTGHIEKRVRPSAERPLRGGRHAARRRRSVDRDRPHARAAARRPRPRTSAAGSCRTWSSRPRSRRSTACGTCSTAWRTRRSGSRGSTTPDRPREITRCARGHPRSVQRVSRMRVISRGQVSTTRVPTPRRR